MATHAQSAELARVKGYTQQMDATHSQHVVEGMYDESIEILKKLRDAPNFNSFKRVWMAHRDNLESSMKDYYIMHGIRLPDGYVIDESKRYI